MNYMIYPDISSFEELIKINKILKSNLIIYNSNNNEIFGFSQDFNDANVLKILKSEVEVDGFKFFDTHRIVCDLPNIAILSKDLNAIYKDYKNTGNIMPIGLDIYNLSWSKPMVFRIGCNTEERLCYDVFSYVNIKDKIINEIKLCKYKGNYNTIKNIDNIYEFEVALNAKAEEGIKIVHYDNELFYIVPTVINKLSSDTIDLNVYYSNFSKILEFVIYKKNHILSIIYRMIDTKLLR